jgi:glyoxylase-like metal-dependent hydrolase (beta-lactamase superfamily II)
MALDTKSYILEPAQFRLDGGAMYGIIPRPLWSKVSPPDEQNRIHLSLRLWLIETKSRLILVDTGIGHHHEKKISDRFQISDLDDPLTQALHQLGRKPTDITDLVISHLHFDHIGGLGIFKDGEQKPIFKDARVHLHREHYEYAKNPTKRDAGSFHSHIFLPILDYYQQNNQIHWLEGEEGNILADEDYRLDFLISHGHTPHMIHPHDNSYFYLADLIPTSNHISVPWVMGYDIAPGVTTEDKIRVLNYICEKELKVIFEHDPKYWGASLKKTDKGTVVMDQGFDLQEDKKAYSI